MNNERIMDSILNVLYNVDIKLYDDDTLMCLYSFKTMPRELQIELFNKTMDNFKLYKEIQLEEENRDICAINGHIYSPWYERVSFKNYNGSSFKNRIWCKKCKKCGNVDFTYIKPKEIVESEEKQILQNEIDECQKKMVKLRKEK